MRREEEHEAMQAESEEEEKTFDFLATVREGISILTKSFTKPPLKFAGEKTKKQDAISALLHAASPSSKAFEATKRSGEPEGVE
ncbi:unnamed protein product, partial [Taenia asiatica]|uniref:Ovule protein n=1 Tax=Taenia asiatica TaxID=60517 RepID=A0A0R3VXV5_TAEAS